MTDQCSEWQIAIIHQQNWRPYEIEKKFLGLTVVMHMPIQKQRLDVKYSYLWNLFL